MAIVERDFVEELWAPSLTERLRTWLYGQAAWYAASFTAHMALACALMLVSVSVRQRAASDSTTTIESSAPAPAATRDALERFDLSRPSWEPTQLSLEPTASAATALLANVAPDADSAGLAPAGGGAEPVAAGAPLGGLTAVRLPGVGGGPASGRGLLGPPGGPGLPASNTPYGVRNGTGRKNAGGASGTTIAVDHAAAAAIEWLARHQNRDGSWSFTQFGRQCTRDTCGGAGSNNADVAATAVALLPFLGAGQTHQTRGPHRKRIYDALYWLLKRQAPDGSLHADARDKMYAHGLAAIALCEAYGLSNDKDLGRRAQAAVNYIVAAQHPSTGGWRYQPGDEGDTSVAGWQVMALKSGQLAALNVPSNAFAGSARFLDLVAAGERRGQFSYTPGQGVGSPAMTAVGLLCRQYLGMRRDDPAMQEGVSTLMKRLPDLRSRPLYFWYYATQVMHNCLGPDWDRWNRQMRRVLIETQIKEGCAHGSWDPDRPQPAEHLSEHGGRLLVTALSALILEVYYRYLPLYKTSS